MIKANFNAYNTYITDSLYQWDIDQELTVSGLNLNIEYGFPEVHFSNHNTDRAIVRQSTLINDIVKVRIPNSLLQEPFTIYAHIGVYEGDTFKVVEKVEIPVTPRERPSDYQIQDTDEEIYSFKALENKIANRATNARVDSVNARIDNLIFNAVNTGDNSEVIDIRMGSDGTVYPTAGYAVREQILKSVSYKDKGCVYPPRSSNIDIKGNNDGSVSITVFADSLTYIESGGTEYGGVAIPYNDILDQIPSNCKLNEDGYLVFTIPEYNALCLDTTTGELIVKSIRTINGRDIVLIYNSWSNVCGGTLLPFYHRSEHNNIYEAIRDQKTFIYIGSNGYIKLDQDGPSGDVRVTMLGKICYSIPTGDSGTTSDTVEIADIITQIGSSRAEAYENGVIITLKCYESLCLNLTTKTVSVTHIRKIKADDIVLLYNSWANVQGLLLTKSLEHRVDILDGNLKEINAFNSGDISYNINTLNKCSEYAELFNDSKEIESFIYFTDPHLLQKGEDYEAELKEYIVTLEKYYNSTSTSFILCGGDWLGNSDTYTEAKYKLAYIHGFMNGMFTNYYSVLGNHDTNYQGVDDNGTTHAGILDNQTITNLWYREYGKNYYAFDGDNTRFYVLDSGTDWDTTLSDYRLSQIEWLGNMLKTEDKPHSAIAIHIFFADTDGKKSVFASELIPLITAYNNRGKFALNGINYDFSACTGRMEFVITGHTHEDMIEYIDSKTPIICTLNTRQGNTPTFDMVYVDYNNRLVNLVRVGTGSNRKINLSS